jgi:hypothetical protein
VGQFKRPTGNKVENGLNAHCLRLWWDIKGLRWFSSAVRFTGNLCPAPLRGHAHPDAEFGLFIRVDDDRRLCARPSEVAINTEKASSLVLAEATIERAWPTRIAAHRRRPGTARLVATLTGDILGDAVEAPPKRDSYACRRAERGHNAQ